MLSLQVLILMIRDECTKEIDMISLFFSSFTLSKEEVEILIGNPKMDKTFFRVLEKLSRVNYNARTVLFAVNPELGYILDSF